MKTETPMKQYLCIEHGEEFLIDAKSTHEARETAALWGGEVIREYKHRKVDSSVNDRATKSAQLEKLKKQHVEVIKKIFLDVTRIRDVKTSKDLKGKVVLALDENLWEKHRNLQWKIFLLGGNAVGQEAS